MAEHDVPFSIDSFIDKLLPHVSASGGWEQVGLRAVARSRRVPVPSFMCVASSFTRYVLTWAQMQAFEGRTESSLCRRYRQLYRTRIELQRV
jgi:hypothetical protein